MAQMREEWLFMQLRAAQLYEEDDVQGALRLMRQINREQIRMFEETAQEYEQTENC